MNNTLNPYGGVNPLIDKMIGNAYDIVKYVAKYLREIRYVAENMKYVFTAANGNRTVLRQTGDGIASTLWIDLPVDFDMATVDSVNVAAFYSSGTVVTFPAPDTFGFSISAGQVVIQLFSVAPQVVSAEYRVTFVHAVTGS